MRRPAFATALLAAALSGCLHRLPAPPPDAVDLVVLAPHPDDEVLMAGGVLQAAVAAGRRAAVIVVTNGDLGCHPDRDAAVRQAETIAALADLGLPEDAVHFLGYPDGHLQHLSPIPLPPVAARRPEGTCATRGVTEATRGAGRTDAHSLRTGQPAPFTSTALTEDLTALLTRLAPRHVYLPHGADTHADHAATLVFFHRALAQLERGPLTLHRALVHAGRCWPTDCQTTSAPDAELPPLPAPLEGYTAEERVAVDGRRKLALIAHFASQTGAHPERDWLAGFARRDERFFPQTLARAPGGAWSPSGLHHTVALPVHHGARLRLQSGEPLDVAMTGTTFTLRRGDLVVAQWALVAPRPPFTLRVEASARPDGYAEWSLWSEGDLIGAGVARGVPVP